ncbi:hypothetical protein [Streptomyces sp. NBC_01187]|uniref:hypothetical protein n=1 Tax=Streptomyces sp. NBC_01187 TaxID=2903766 RepID=UPI0038658C6B|nr:hypothetical protein OG220_26285 [Streptomyces sp. NBC_01187]
MSDSSATLAAAAFAAVVSLVNLLVTALAGRKAEARAAHREILNDHLPELADSLAQAIAISHELHQIAVNDGGAQRRSNWLERAAVVVKDLKAQRPRVRYQLWGLDEGLRTMARVPDWINRYVGDHVALGHDFLEEADRLGEVLDDAIRRSYQQGRPPTKRSARHVQRQAARVRAAWESHQRVP